MAGCRFDKHVYSMPNLSLLKYPHTHGSILFGKIYDTIHFVVGYCRSRNTLNKSLHDKKKTEPKRWLVMLCMCEFNIFLLFSIRSHHYACGNGEKFDGWPAFFSWIRANKKKRHTLKLIASVRIITFCSRSLWTLFFRAVASLTPIHLRNNFISSDQAIENIWCITHDIYDCCCCVHVYSHCVKMAIEIFTWKNSDKWYYHTITTSLRLNEHM